MKPFPIHYAALVAVLVGATLACSPGGHRPASKLPTPKPAAAASPGRSASPVRAASTGSPTTGTIRFGEFTYAYNSTKDARQRTELELEADEFYFDPTFMQGAPGQTLTLFLQNETRNQTLHNFSLPSQQLDRDIPAGRQRFEVQVTFPSSGGLRFFCKYHSGQGMNGQLLVGDIEPQPVSDTGLDSAG
jgi:plastocyanin